MSMALPNGCRLMVGPVHPAVACGLTVCAGAWAAPRTPTAAAPIVTTAAIRMAGLLNQRAGAVRMKAPFAGLLTGIEKDPPAIVSANILEVIPFGAKTSDGWPSSRPGGPGP